MASYILTQSAVIMCPHGGIVNHVPTGMPKYRINGELPMVMTDQYLFGGCPNMMPIGPTMVPSPCMRINWVTGSNFLFVRGIPALTNLSTGVCHSVHGPTGPPVITSFQMLEQEPRTVTRVD